MVTSARETLIDILRTQSIHGLHLGMTDQQIEAQLGEPDHIEVPYIIEDEDIWQVRHWTYKDLFLALKENLLTIMSLEMRGKDILESKALSIENSNAFREMKHKDLVPALKSAGFNLKCINDPIFLDSVDYDERELLFLPEMSTSLTFDINNQYCLASISITDKAHYWRGKLTDC